jgi:hypothetical protein
VIKVSIETGPQWFEVIDYNSALTAQEAVTLTSAAVVEAKYAAQRFKTSELQKMLNEAEKLIADATGCRSDGGARLWFGSIATTWDELAMIRRRCADLHASVEGLSCVIARSWAVSSWERWTPTKRSSCVVEVA